MRQAGLYLLIIIQAAPHWAWASKAPTLDCENQYAAMGHSQSPLTSGSLAAKMRENDLSLKSNVYASHADGSPYMVELSIETPDGRSLASLEVQLRPGGEAYVSHVARDSMLKGLQVSGWLKKKLLEKYPIRKISSTLSETEFARVEPGLKAHEAPEVAARRSIAYSNCLELGFTDITVRLKANSLDVDCARPR